MKSRLAPSSARLAERTNGWGGGVEDFAEGVAESLRPMEGFGADLQGVEQTLKPSVAHSASSALVHR